MLTSLGRPEWIARSKGVRRHCPTPNRRPSSCGGTEVGSFYWTVLAPDIVNAGRIESAWLHLTTPCIARGLFDGLNRHTFPGSR